MSNLDNNNTIPAEIVDKAPAPHYDPERWWIEYPYRGHLMTFCLSLVGATIALLAGVFMIPAASWWDASPFLLICLFFCVLAMNHFAIMHGWKPVVITVYLTECQKCHSQKTYTQVNTPVTDNARTQPGNPKPDSAPANLKEVQFDPAGLAYYQKFRYFFTEIVNTGECTERYWTQKKGMSPTEYDNYMEYLKAANLVYTKGRGSGTKLIIEQGNLTEAYNRINRFLGFDLDKSIAANTPHTANGVRQDYFGIPKATTSAVASQETIV